MVCKQFKKYVDTPAFLNYKSFFLNTMNARFQRMYLFNSRFYDRGMEWVSRVPSCWTIPRARVFMAPLPGARRLRHMCSVYLRVSHATGKLQLTIICTIVFILYKYIIFIILLLNHFWADTYLNTIKFNIGIYIIDHFRHS